MADLITTDLEFAESTEPITEYPGYAGFVRVRTFKKSEHTIFLVVVADENAATIIFNFYSTMDMNFISGYGLFCAYPELTLNKLSYVNPAARDPSNDGHQFKRLNAKLRHRGFIHYIHLHEHDKWRDHLCGESKYCPLTLRSMHDQESLFIPFASTSTESAGPAMYDGVHSVIWALGGPPCSGEGLYHGLVTLSVPVYQAQHGQYTPLKFSRQLRIVLDDVTMWQQSTSVKQ
ncbi:hypothetical protein R3P38DRAFT_2773737 [Favolaschia claudopus]|uniref:Uncharacterized protein n=1 Tax=Favolaschia claudopus TaxID=2862362 RepID=A0AAW0C433_9AGAR